MDIKNMKYKPYTEALKHVVTCDLCDNGAIGYLYKDGDLYSLESLDICEDHYNKLIVDKELE